MKDRGEKYQNQRSNIIIKNGIDVKKQTIGSGVGEIFPGNLNDYGTYVISGKASAMWQISFHKLKTGKSYRFRFQNQMWIGRAPADSQGEVRLVLEDDPKVSRTHCVIYADKGRLCISDWNSANHTWLNGKRVERPARLNHGDIICVGDSRFQIDFGR